MQILDNYFSLQTKAAYVLFYQRRDLAAGGPVCNGRMNGDSTSVEDMDTN